MRHGSATVVTDTASGTLAVSASVAVERPDDPASSYLRCVADLPKNLRAAALSGARFARHALDRHRFGIEVREVVANLDVPEVEQGLAVAVTFAAWSAWGYRWTDSEARQMAGWSLRQSDA